MVHHSARQVPESPLASPVLACSDGYLATGTWVPALLRASACADPAASGPGAYTLLPWHECAALLRSRKELASLRGPVAGCWNPDCVV